MAWVMPLIWDRSPSETIIPAGSSPALLIRRPVLSRVMLFCMLLSLIVSWRIAVIAGIFVLILKLTFCHSVGFLRFFENRCVGFLVKCGTNFSAVHF